MLTNWWLTALGAFEVVAPILVLFVLVRRKLVGSWPSLTAALAFEVVSNLVLCSMLRHRDQYALYFYLFWLASGVQALLRLWITADIVRAIPGISFFPRSAYAFVGVAGLAMSVAAAAWTWRDPVSTHAYVVGTVLLLNRAVNMAWIAFFVAMLAVLKLMRIGWNPLGASITSGVVLRIGASALAAELYTRQAFELRLAGNAVDSLTSIAVLLYWAFSLNAPSLDSTWSLEDDSDAARICLRILQEAVPQRER